jgi:hypothetical protein
MSDALSVTVNARLSVLARPVPAYDTFETCRPVPPMSVHRGKNGSDRRAVKVVLMTPTRHLALAGGPRAGYNLEIGASTSMSHPDTDAEWMTLLYL